MAYLPEKREHLMMLAAPPLIWAAHFLASYVTAAVWCAKVAEPFGPVRTAIAVYTVVALAGIGVAAWKGARRHSFGSARVPHDFDTAEDRHRFLGFATLLLAGLSAVATIFVALTAVFVQTCH